jgi:hypothetical protein
VEQTGNSLEQEKEYVQRKQISGDKRKFCLREQSLLFQPETKMYEARLHETSPEL